MREEDVVSMKALLSLLVVSLIAAPGFAAATAPAPRGGTLIIADGVDATAGDAALFTDSPTAERFEHLCESLFGLTDDGKVQPELATSWAFSADGKRLTVNLRSGVKFHDGTPFNADAVKFNLERILDPATRSFWRGVISPITQVVVLNPSTVVLLFSAPFAPVLANLTHSGLCMQSPTAIQTRGADYARSPVGTGPYRVKEWVRGDRFVLARFDDYWGEKGTLDEIVWRVIPDDGARVAAVEAGTVHVAKRVPPLEVDRLRGNRALRVTVVASLRTIYIGFNVTKAPFNNKKVRQALNYAISKEAIVKALLGGAARVSDAPITPGVVGYSPIMTYPYDLDRARQLLREAGFPTGLSAVFHHPTARYIRDAEIAAAVQGLLRRVGVNLELRTAEFATYVDLLGKPVNENTVQMYMLGWGTVTGDADYGLYSLFHSSNWAPSPNRSFYKNPQVDSLLERARAALDPAERDRLYRQAMEIIMDDAPWLFLHSESQVTAFRADLQNIRMTPAERIVAGYAWFRR